LVARSQERLAAGVAALEGKGIAAAAFPADAADPRAVAAAIGQARAGLGPITVVHWNAFGGVETGELLAADPAAVRAVFDVAVVGLLAAVQAALPDLKAAGDGAVLVTNGAFGDPSPAMDQLAIALKSMGVALANAAKAKLVGLLAQALRGEGVYVGEVTVAGAIKETAWASGGEGIAAATVANRFWDLYQARDAVRARVS